MKPLILTLFLALLSATTLASPPERVWVTVDESGWQLLQGINPALVPLAEREPDTEAILRGAGRTGTLRVAELSLAERDALAVAVHRDLRHCGGFVAHDSLAAALAALEPADLGFVPTRPAYVIDQQPLVLPLLAAASDQRIGEDIQSLAAFHNRYYNGEHGAAAADWLAEHWQAITARRGDIRIDKVYRGDDAMPSVVLTIPGTTMLDQVLVIGAHLDSVNWTDYYGGTPHNLTRAPGADDDASGVASMTEVLRAIVSSGFHPQRSIRLMAYSGEEFGLYGSSYIAGLYAEDKVDVAGMLQLDMTNYQGSEADIYIIDDETDAQQNVFLEQLAAEYLPELAVDQTTCGYSCSDHSSWNERGYAASFPFEARMGEDNPWIHTSNDTWENSGSQALHALKFSRLATAWLVELATDNDVIFANGVDMAL